MARSTTDTKGRKRVEQQARRKQAQKKKLIRNGVVIGLAALALLVLLVSTWPEPEVGSTEAEAWDLPALVGDGRYTLSDFNGQPTVAVFFASWCTVCEHEIPEFLAVSQEIGDRVNFVGINSQDNGRGGGDADKWGITGEWPIAKDIGGRNQSGLSVETFGARGMPLTVIYTSDGAVAHIQRGGMSGQQLVALLTDLGLLS
ncbi:MAG: TlpA disulfide reductase family protein [Actinomycetota bacterium]|nr:TlpA disulfide reductase family protein [Actinomycetota bacterium]MDK1026090.1 TlpA disulfide reductase family protein [Actinomycetota bacterium]MDK1038446.1 TlpA disulfide reductase family protein [Actinomycetota bacterium]MDK1096744.1 TlpA disulfide reductase family protein [Actinomycetota bacterium]MDK1292132.1 TlpA disulfide reductase family protein [Actinomycetota bacterium]